MVNWNKEQKAVIESRKLNTQILVSAAAGSGKTAVLVERILQSLLDKVDDEYVNDIDDFLVVTFTRAAAAQMKDKITKKIGEMLSEEGAKEYPDRKKLDHLAKQQIAVGRADICTLDSFSAKVVRENFSVINIDPAFTTVEGDMMKLVKDDVIDEMLGELFSGNDGKYVKAEDFALLAGVFFKKTDDAELKKVFFDIMRVAETMPDPVKWLEECRIKEGEDREKSFNSLPWVGLLMDDIRGRMESALSVNDKVIRIAERLKEEAVSDEELKNSAKMLEKAKKDRELIERYILSADRRRGGSYRSFLNMLGSWSFDNNSKKDDSEYTRERSKYSLKTGMIGSVMNVVLGRGKVQDVDSVMSDIYDNSAKWIDIIVDFCLEYYERAMAEKHRRRQYEFSDIAHFALKILSENEKTAKQFTMKYKYIYIDEYQDSNYIQEDMVNAIASFRNGHPSNIFMVGDVKQSIYRFRQAKPELFVRKYDSFAKMDEEDEEAPGMVIDLSTNYRSRKPVLDAVNRIFRELMKKDLGGIDYNDRVALNYGAGEQGIYDKEGDFPVQLTVITNPSEEEGESGKADERITNDEYEAAVVAEKIAAILEDEKFLVNAGDGTKRRVMPSDIVILMRGIKGRTDVYIDALGRRGIGAKVDNNVGYFDAAETVTMLSMLRVIDNRRQDIPLAAVLNSQIGGLSNSDLMIIAGDDPDRKKFYERCMEFMEKYGSRREVAVSGITTNGGTTGVDAGCFGMTGDNDIEFFGMSDDTAAGDAVLFGDAADEDTETYEKKHIIAVKLERFFGMVNELADKQGYITIAAMIREILERTGYDIYVSSLPSGDRRLANLSMLMQKADDFEQSNFSGLFDFLRYIDKCRIHDIDFAEADVDADGSNKVTIMSIHKSKGLEFPVVFLVGLGHEFNKMDAQGNIFVDGDNHLAVSFMDPKRRMIDKGFMMKAMIRLSTLGRVEEEQRLLYVGMTRARERLFMTGIDKSYYKTKSAEMDYKTRSSFKNYLTWIEPVVSRDEEKCFELEVLSFGDIKDIGDNAGKDMKQDYDRLVEVLEKEAFSDDVRKKVNEIMEIYDQNKNYSYRESTGTRAKMSVTGIKKSLNKPEDEDSLRYAGVEYDETQTVQGESYAAGWMQQGDTYVAGQTVRVDENSYSARQDQQSDTYTAGHTAQGDEKPAAQGEAYAAGQNIQEDAYTAARRGTLVHKVFELIDFKKVNSPADMKKEAMKALKNPYFTDADRLDILESNDLSKISRFADTELFKAMKAADERGQLFKEAEFTMGVPVKRLERFVNPDAKGDEVNETTGNVSKITTGTEQLQVSTDLADEKDRIVSGDVLSGENAGSDDDIVIIQGIIDGYYIDEDGRAVIMDYKTDRTRIKDELIRHHGEQLKLYQEALSGIKGVEVKGLVIYSLEVGEVPIV